MPIGRMLPHLEQGTVVIVYSDHGGRSIMEWGHHGTLIADDLMVPFIARVV